MKILTISGSPKKKESSSEYLLRGLENYLDEASQIDLSTLQEIKSFDEYQAVVIAFPLYVDGIPSNLLEWMKNIEENLKLSSDKPMVYIVVNAGFYEPEQNRHAVEIIKNWCAACGTIFGGAVAIGGGGMAQMAPIGKGPSKNIGTAFELLAEKIQKSEEIKTQFIKPKFPRFLYMKAAHIGWRQHGKQNGNSSKKLYEQWGD